jgi:hypothetical protein
MAPRCRRWLLALALLWAQPAWLAPRRLALRLGGITALWGAGAAGAGAQEFGAPGRKVPLDRPWALDRPEMLVTCWGHMLGAGNW